MRTDQPGPLRIGQVLSGLLDDVAASDDESEGESAPPGRAPPRGHRSEESPSLFDLMMAAVDKKFDADEDEHG